MNLLLLPIELDIDFMPQLNHPLMRAYVDEDVEFNEHHINAIYEAIEYADKVMYGRD